MIVSFGWPSSHHRTGGVVALYRFANGLAERGHEVHFIHGPAWPDRIDRIEELSWFRFADGVVHHIVDSFDDPSMPSADVIFADLRQPRLGHKAMFIQGAGMMPLSMERDAYRLRGPKVCIARWLVDLGLTYGVPREQLWHVPMGIDHEVFVERTPHDDRRFDVALLYNPHPAKGWGVGYEALLEVRRRVPDLQAVVFGASAPPEELPDWIEFHLHPDHEHLARQVYDASRVFVQASYHEGFGFTAVEAMACGAALVTTDNGGSDDYAVPDETALVVPPGDAGALADGIEALVVDAGRRTRLARAGERAVRRFDWAEGSAVLEAHLERYVADPARFQEAPADDEPTLP